MEAFYAVLPVFLLIAVGAAVHMTDVLPENTGAAMGLYVLKLALPVLMLHILSVGFWLGVIGAQMLCYLLGYAVDRLFSRRGTGPAIISGLACSASNTAFVGLPIVAGLLPGNHEAMVVAGLAALTPNVVVIMAQIRMDCLAGSAAWGDGRGRIWKLLRLFLLGNPLLLATLAGLALACSGLGLWQPLDHAAALIGSTAAPCMLLALGFDLRQNGGHTVIRQAWLLLCKLGIHPLICWGIMHLAGLPPLWLGVGVLMSATGTALVASVLAEVYSAVPEEAALTAVLSNAASMVSLMLFIFLLQGAGCL